MSDMIFDSEGKVVVPLNDAADIPLNKNGAPKKPWGCESCLAFQYTPEFKADGYKCKLDPLREKNVTVSHNLSGRGSSKASVMFVYESPSRNDDQRGESFVSAQARIVIRNLGLVGISEKDCYFTGAAKCHKPGMPFTFKQAIPCTRFLSQEVRQIKPRIIVPLGSLALKLVIGNESSSIDEFRTVPTKANVAGHECILFPLWSPGYVLRNDYLTGQYIEHFEKLGRLVAGQEEPAVDNSRYKIITKFEKVLSFLGKLAAKLDQGPLDIAWDLETSGLNPYASDSRITVISFALDEERGWCIPVDHDECPWTAEQRAEIIVALKVVLTHKNIRSILQNGKFDYKWVRQIWGFWPRDLVLDTMLLHYATDENEAHGLKQLALQWTDMGDYDAELDQYIAQHFTKSHVVWDKIALRLLGVYNAMDAVATNKVKNAIQQAVDGQDEFVAALARVVLPRASNALMRMEHNGGKIDEEFTLRAVPHLEKVAKASFNAILAERHVRQFIRDKTAIKPKFQFSLRSPLQLAELLFSKKYMGNIPVSLSKTGKPKTDKETLNALNDIGCPISTSIIEWRLDDSMVKRCLDAVERVRTNVDGLLHGNFLLHTTVTGRLSSQDPNLQNIPNKSAGLVKRMYISRWPGDGIIVQADYSQIELRILGAVSGDEGMIQAYIDGEDLHEQTACLIFGLTKEQYAKLDDATKKQYRTVAKRVNFGIAYGIGGPGIQRNLKSEGIIVDVQTATSYIDIFKRKRKAVARWIEEVERSTAEQSISRSLFGRRRRLEQVYSNNPEVVAKAMRQAVNHPIQSTASDFTLTSLILLDQRIRKDRMSKIVKPVATVHDSIVFDTKGLDAARYVAGLIQEIMPNVVDLAPEVWGDIVRKPLRCMKRIPIQADMDVGLNWRDVIGFEQPEEIEAAMFVSYARRAKLDNDFTAKWEKADEAAAREAFKNRSSHAEA